MKYTAQFSDLSLSPKLYDVTITTSEGDGTAAVTLGGTPFTTSMRSSEDNLYVPVKYSGATVNVITGDYMMDIYSPTAQGTKVELTSGGIVVWTGYATPCLYDMGFVDEREEIAIECVDALATLKCYRYECETLRVRLMRDILADILGRCNAYKAAFISTNTKLGATPLIDVAEISEELFFGDDEDDTWTCADVLEEICRYLGVTALADGDKVWLVDYDAIKAGTATYEVLSLDGGSYDVPTIPSKYIDGSDYAGGDARISLAPVYNKVTVKDTFATYDNMFPDFFDVSNLRPRDSGYRPTAPSDANIRRATIPYEYNGTTGTLNIMLTEAYAGEAKNKNKKTYFVAQMEMESDYIATTAPLLAGGAFLKREFSTVIDDLPSTSPWSMSDANFIEWATDEVSTLSFTTSIEFNVGINAGTSGYPLMSTNANNITYNIYYKDYPLAHILIPSEARVFGGVDGSYLLLSGNIMISDGSGCSFDKKSFTSDDAKDCEVDPSEEYIYVQLRWGDKYYAYNEWHDTPTQWRLYFNTADATDMEAVRYKSLPLRNNVKWWQGIDSEGVAIPLPSDTVMSGDIELTIYTPPHFIRGLNLDNKPDYPYYNDVGFNYYYWLTDLKLEPKIASFGESDTDSDTVYTNVIDEGYTEELDDIEFKICTFDGKKPNHSSVMAGGGYVDTTTNTACSAGEADWDGSTAKALRQEEHMIYRLVNQYSTPSVVLTLPLHVGQHPAGAFTDKTMSGRLFILDTSEIDYKDGSQKVRLIEKK